MKRNLLIHECISFACAIKGIVTGYENALFLPEKHAY